MTSSTAPVRGPEPPYVRGRDAGLDPRLSSGRAVGGWLSLVAAVGLVLSVVADGLADLPAWSDVTPVAVADVARGVAAVALGFASGQLVPSLRRRRP